MVAYPSGMEGGYATPRLDVRPWRHAEVDAMFEIYSRWEVARWLGATPRVVESAESLHATVDRWGALADGPLGVWAVVLRATGQPIGTVLLVHLVDAAGQ